MSGMRPLAKSMSRQSIVAALRRELLNRADGRSICTLAAEQNIFCGGFRRFSDAELRERFAWIAARRPAATREELEIFGDAWQLARQEVRDLPTSCDVQRREHDLCNGWEDFSDRELSTFYWELTHREVSVRPARRETEPPTHTKDN